MFTEVTFPLMAAKREELSKIERLTFDAGELNCNPNQDMRILVLERLLEEAGYTDNRVTHVNFAQYDNKYDTFKLRVSYRADGWLECIVIIKARPDGSLDADWEQKRR